MPSLDDIPTLNAAIPSGDDLFPIYDNTASGSSRIRKTALNTLLGLASSDVSANITGSSGTITNRFTILSGNASGEVAITLPAASGILHEVIIQNANTGTSTLKIISPTTNLFTAASATAVANVTGYTNNNYYWFHSDGTSWYRTH